MRYAGLPLLLLAAACSAAAPAADRTLGSGSAASKIRKEAAKTAALTLPSGKTLRVDVADTPAARERGLMFRKSLPKDYGMLFVFPVEQGMSFWMKNTWVSLDIVFIGRDKRITAVHRKVRPSTEKTTDAEVARVGGLAQYVLELPAGAAARHKLEVGQELTFEAAVPFY